MPLVDLCLTSSSSPAGELAVRLGEPLLDAYLEFVAARCRPNTVLATAYDLKVFFSVVGKPPAEVSAADVLGFVTAQRAGTLLSLIASAQAGCRAFRPKPPTHRTCRLRHFLLALVWCTVGSSSGGTTMRKPWKTRSVTRVTIRAEVTGRLRCPHRATWSLLRRGQP